MVKELAQIVGSKVNEWCNDETPLEDCIETAEKVLQWHSNDNGYEISKEFEYEGFFPDSELVEILDSVSYYRSKVQKALTLNNGKMFIKCTSAPILATLC